MLKVSPDKNTYADVSHCCCGSESYPLTPHTLLTMERCQEYLHGASVDCSRQQYKYKGCQLFKKEGLTQIPGLKF